MSFCGKVWWCFLMISCPFWRSRKKSVEFTKTILWLILSFSDIKIKHEMYIFCVTYDEVESWKRSNRKKDISCTKWMESCPQYYPTICLLPPCVGWIKRKGCNFLVARQIGDKIVQKLIKLYFWRPNYATKYSEQFLIKGQVCHVPVFKMAAIFKMAAVLSENLRKNVEIDTLKVLFPGHRRVPVTIMLSCRLSGHSSTHTHIRPSICPSVRPFVVLYTRDHL